MKSILPCVLLIAAPVCALEVNMSEEIIVLPTYETESPDRIPLFFRPEEVQLAEKHVYPYPFYDVKTSEKKPKEYLAVILENEFLKICVTPEMGGRLYYAVDKTNGYDIIYNNRVVKPALIGTIGAWTSGGVEWNTPHHHRATSLIAVDHTLVEDPDGSRTVWVGEYEKRSQTRWLVGMTLEPGKAYVKISFRSMNVTPYQYPALFFSNAAVHVNDDYQFIFPPDVDMMNFHYVSEFTRWPVLNQVYQSTDYTRGEDLSWWREAKQPVSFFVTKTSQDFMGGIDHGKKAGIVKVGDHRIFKGKKLWNWGKNEVQASWDEKLTDEDGPYAELMMGMYSDNQPDYTFVAPFETKYGEMYMYGIKGMDGIKEANKDFAINLDLKDGLARIQVNATTPRPDIRIRLMVKEETVFEETATISPEQPYQHAHRVAADVSLEDMQLTLFSADNNALISWQKQPPRNEPFPETAQDPRDPREYTNSQDLFFAGLKLEQFGNTNYDYMKYYEAALRLNPNDVLTNTQLGLVYLKKGKYREAEIHLRKAVDVVTGNHKKAQDATPLYYLGVCLMKQGRREEALELLYRATWDYAWTSAGYTLAAQIEAGNGQWEKALDAASRACEANAWNIEALLCKAIILGKLCAYKDALDAAKEALTRDPLSFVAMNELRLLAARAPADTAPDAQTAALLKRMRTEPYNYIETASRYSAMGLYEEAAEIMALAAESPQHELSAYPMTHYHLGMYRARAGQEVQAVQALDRAAALPTTLCFPYGDESVTALRFALDRAPDDASAWYLLGNALANHQHEEAVSAWEMAIAKGREDAIIYRNIAYIQANHLHKMPEALANIMKAISLDASEPRYFSEADLYMSYASLTAQQLEEFLSVYGDMGQHITDIRLMAIKLNLFQGSYDEAIRLLSEMTYHMKEGATFNPHVYWFDAHLQCGIQRMNEGAHAAAASAFLRGMEFPVNLGAERNGKIGIAYYYLGLNSKLSGDQPKANDYFAKMTDYTYSQGWGAGDFPEIEYFKTLAAMELGLDQAGAAQRFEKLIEDGKNRIITVRDSRHITVSVDESHGARLFLLENEIGRKALRLSSYYLQGLGYLGLGDKEQARAHFNKALAEDPLGLDPKRMLESIQ